ncbi:flagellar filament capping protein FliD [Aliidiomarina halalkaliphila]|uniref:Flagellar hook-associated protein 2 n=1 Tax=Aliidiomarina halalkaliphila TaxID=2593535 RepID=A0A552X1A9_9GAMM|nr:flagellar filament capping protein FliD [Aliidiomarina halalkaliphila]TRW48831.1 flagellar filament capping protein FliD [Aliidiomarina halalkaliphila]
MASISALGIGSGMDLNGLLDQLKAAERQKLQPITQQKRVQQAKISAFGKLESALTNFREAAAKLNQSATFNGVSSQVSGSAVKAAAGSNAPVGTFSVNVTQRAQAYSIATAGVADQSAQLGGGSVNFTLGNGDAVSIEIDPAKSSLTDIRNAINQSNSGVQASIVNDGSGTPYRLVMSSAQTGTEAAITSIDFGGDLNGQLNLDANTEIAARNAELNVNGVAITSQSNRVEGAIQGVTLDLEEVGAATVNITRDTELTTDAIKDFVKSYNTLQKTMADLTRFGGEGGTNGELLGDSTLRTVQQRLRSVMSAGVSEGDMRMLRDVGIDMKLDGTLELNEAKLGELTSSNMTGLTEFFAGSSRDTGLAGKLNSSVGLLLQSDGPIKNSTKGLQDSMRRLDLRFERMEDSIDRTIERYRSQFAQLDSMVARMNSTSSYLMQQFDIMNAQLGRN